VKLSTSSHGIYGEKGRHPLVLKRKVRIVKFWLKLLHNGQRNCILWNVYECMLQTAEYGQQNWASKVKKLLDECGFGEVWLYPRSVDINAFIPIFKRRCYDIYDLYVIKWRVCTRSSPSMYHVI
jgi:hypothetical protein